MIGNQDHKVKVRRLKVGPDHPAEAKRIKAGPDPVAGAKKQRVDRDHVVEVNCRVDQIVNHQERGTLCLECVILVHLESQGGGVFQDQIDHLVLIMVALGNQAPHVIAPDRPENLAGAQKDQ